MDDSTVAEIRDWSADPFEGGYDGLHRLADRSFTGAVEADGTYLFVLNGTPVGVADGSIEQFDGADGTAYAAPHPSLPLLFAMQERGGETRGQYYTEDTPVSEVDATLTDGGFTGYLELSENVLSGDYYAVYQQGKSMNVAFVGQSRRVLTGEEAWAKTRDEVGIYAVTAVPLEPLEIPGDPPADADLGGAAGATASGAAAGGSADSTTAADAGTAPDDGEPTADDGEPAADDGGATADPLAPSEPTDADASTGEESDIGVAPADPSEFDAADSATGEPDPPTGDEESGGEEAATAAPETDAESAEAGTEDQVTAVPSVDPERSPGEAAGAEESGGADAATVDLVEEVEAELEEREAELREAKRHIDELRERRDELKRQLESVRAERDELRAELEALGAGGDGGRSLSPSEARAGTTLFVRYDSKGKTTLDDLQAGEGDPGALRRNLRIEYHTEFEDDGVVVDGQPLESFVLGSQAARFLEWLVTELFVEIQATGTVRRLSTLYEAIPAIDRVELDRSLTVPDGADEEEVSFDLVARDKTGKARLVADLNDDREPVGERALADLVEAASAGCRAEESLAAAFGVATSYFDADALETARAATSGSLLSRDKRESFVKLSRNRGFHLGLVEDRDDSFHLSVPDL